jgi:hypothetical protein
LAIQHAVQLQILGVHGEMRAVTLYFLATLDTEDQQGGRVASTAPSLSISGGNILR